MGILRTYHRTHHWINFKFDMNKLDSKMWLQLGQIEAVCRYISGTPLSPEAAQDLYQIYLAKGIHATTAIEGNTLTEEEVRQLLEGDVEFPPSKEYLKQEIANVNAAMNYIADNILIEQTPTALQTGAIKKYNHMVLDGLDLKPEVALGEYRSHDVRVASYKGAPPEDLALLMEEMCKWLNGWEEPAQFKVSLGILKAIIAHVYLAWIHPFGDGNGRIARLLELQILLGVGLPMPTAHLLSNHYNQTRSEYYRYLSITSEKENGLYDFIGYALQGFIDQLEEQVRYIKIQQLVVHWESHVYTQFRNKDGTAATRKRRLVLDLLRNPDPTPIPKLRHISPRIAEAYAGKTERTIQRDVAELEKMGLILRTSEGVQANLSILQAFLPPVRQ